MVYCLWDQNPIVKVEDAFPAENAGSAKWGWIFFLIKPYRLRQINVKWLKSSEGIWTKVQKSKWSKQFKHAHHLKKCQWFEIK